VPCQPAGHNVYEELSSGLSLLAFGAEEASVEALRQAAKRLSAPLKVIEDSYEDGRRAYQSRLVLVRPDQHVIWNGDQAPAEPAAMMRRVTGLS